MLKRTTASLITIGAIFGILGCDMPTFPTEAPKVKQTVAVQKKEHVFNLDKYVDNYNQGDIKTKGLMIRELYDGQALLVKFSYTPKERASKSYSNVHVEIDDSVIIEYLEGKIPVAELELANKPIRVRTKYGKIVRSSWQEGVPLKIPPGYSVLIVKDDRVSQHHSGDILWGLRRFARENPHLFPNYRQVGAVRQGLSLLMGY